MKRFIMIAYRVIRGTEHLSKRELCEKVHMELCRHILRSIEDQKYVHIKNQHYEKVARLREQERHLLNELNETLLQHVKGV